MELYKFRNKFLTFFRFDLFLFLHERRVDFRVGVGHLEEMVDDLVVIDAESRGKFGFILFLTLFRNNSNFFSL